MPKHTDVGIMQLVCRDGEVHGYTLTITAPHVDKFGKVRHHSIGDEVNAAVDCYYESTGVCVADHPKRIVEVKLMLHSLTHENAPGTELTPYTPME